MRSPLTPPTPARIGLRGIGRQSGGARSAWCRPARPAVARPGSAARPPRRSGGRGGRRPRGRRAAWLGLLRWSVTGGEARSPADRGRPAPRPRWPARSGARASASMFVRPPSSTDDGRVRTGAGLALMAAPSSSASSPAPTADPQRTGRRGSRAARRRRLRASRAQCDEDDGADPAVVHDTTPASTASMGGSLFARAPSPAASACAVPIRPDQRCNCAHPRGFRRADDDDVVTWRYNERAHPGLGRRASSRCCGVRRPCRPCAADDQHRFADARPPDPAASAGLCRIEPGLLPARGAGLRVTHGPHDAIIEEAQRRWSASSRLACRRRSPTSKAAAALAALGGDLATAITMTYQRLAAFITSASARSSPRRPLSSERLADLCLASCSAAPGFSGNARRRRAPSRPAPVHGLEPRSHSGASKRWRAPASATPARAPSMPMRARALSASRARSCSPRHRRGVLDELHHLGYGHRQAAGGSDAVVASLRHARGLPRGRRRIRPGVAMAIVLGGTARVSGTTAAASTASTAPPSSRSDIATSRCIGCLPS